MSKLVVHIAEIDISEESGMGRVAWHWRREFEKRGYEFIHIGLTQVGALAHPGLFPYKAYQVYKKLKRKASFLLVHEPASGLFANLNVPVAVVSHGVERRSWQLRLGHRDGTTKPISQRTKLLFPLWRLRQCDIGLKNANLLLLINQEDSSFVNNYYRRDETNIYVFKNGIYATELNEDIQPDSSTTVTFIGSWIERKGIKTLVEAAKVIYEKGLRLTWLLAGAGKDEKSVLDSFPDYLHPFLKIIPSFVRAQELELLSSSNIFVLPSFFEGQPLSLLQAMETGRCCIATNCCGQRDFIEHGYNGLLHEPGNAQELANLVEQCVKDKALRMSLGRNARRSVKDRSWDVAAAEVVARTEAMLTQYENFRNE